MTRCSRHLKTTTRQTIPCVPLSFGLWKVGTGYAPALRLITCRKGEMQEIQGCSPRSLAPPQSRGPSPVGSGRPHETPQPGWAQPNPPSTLQPKHPGTSTPLMSRLQAKTMTTTRHHPPRPERPAERAADITSSGHVAYVVPGSSNLSREELCGSRYKTTPPLERALGANTREPQPLRTETLSSRRPCPRGAPTQPPCHAAPGCKRSTLRPRSISRMHPHAPPYTRG